MTLSSIASSVPSYSFQIISLVVLLSILNFVGANTLERDSAGDKLPTQTMSLEPMPSPYDPIAKLRSAKLLLHRKIRSLVNIDDYISSIRTLNTSAIDTKILDLKSILEMAEFNTDRGGSQTQTENEMPNENSNSVSLGHSQDLLQFKDITDFPNLGGSQTQTKDEVPNANRISGSQENSKDLLQLKNSTDVPYSNTNSTADKKKIPDHSKAVTVEEPNLLFLNKSLYRLENNVKNAKNIFKFNDLFSQTEDIDEHLETLYKGFKTPSKSKQYRTAKRSIFSVLQEIKTRIIRILENDVKEASSNVDLKVDHEKFHDLQTRSKSFLKRIKNGVTLKNLIAIEDEIFLIIYELKRLHRK